jgi:hypothetical protein
MKIVYNIILTLICICIFLIIDILLETILPILSSFKTKNTILHKVIWWLWFLFVLTSSVIITDLIRRKIPRILLIFALLISLGFLIVIVYLT